MSRARLFAACLILALSSAPSSAQRGNDFDSVLAQMNAAMQASHWPEALSAAQKLEILVRRKQGADNMNYAGVLHNEGMFLHNLGRYQEAIDKFNAALAIKLRNNDVASTLRTSNILVASLGMLDRRAEAKAVADRALTLGTNAFGANDPRLLDTLSALGGLSTISSVCSPACRPRTRRLSRSPLPWTISATLTAWSAASKTAS
jgi:tetratricopeptide (TPR) repeat protein